MKRIKKYTAFIFIIIVVFLISGCSFNYVTLSTDLIIDENFSGERIIKLNLKDSLLSPKSFKSTEVSEFIFSKSPKVLDVQKIRNNNSTDYRFILKFDSLDDYRTKIKNLINEDAEVSFFYSKDNPFTKGLKIFENFSSKELLNFIDLESKDDTIKILKNIKSSGTKLIFNGESHWTSSKITFSNIDFLPVDKITMYTKNNLDGTYNREFKIKFLKNVCERFGSDLYEYVSNLKDPRIISFGVTSSNDFEEYSLLYINLDLISLKEVTSKFLNLKKSSDIDYLIYDKKTTFMEKYSLFNEVLDLSSFSTDNKKINVEYFYECANEIAGINVYSDSAWNYYHKELIKKAYLVKSNNSIFKVHFFDRKCYTVDGLIFKLKHLEGDNFEKSVKFSYSKENAFSFDYLKEYLKFKGIKENLNFFNSEANDICEVSKQGSIEDISNYYNKLFGSENYSKSNVKSYDFGLFDTVKVKDNISLLNSNVDNRSVPISYIISDDSDNLGKSIKYSVGYKKVRVPMSKDKSLDTTFNIKNDNFTVTYKYNQRNSLKIVIVFLIIFFILIGVIFIIFIVNRKTKNKLEVSHERGD